MSSPIPPDYLPPIARVPRRPESSAEQAKPNDPVRLASITMRAVGEISEGTAVEIERTADAVEAGAHEVANHLRELAQAIRNHGAVAGSHVTAFCERTNHVLETVRALADNLKPAPDTTEQEPRKPVPEFLRKDANGGQPAGGGPA